jgi:tetratricopeptide (TPR) repeat protein
MSGRAVRGIVLAALMIVGTSGVWKLQTKIDEQRASLHVESEDLMLRSGGMVKKLSLEYAPLVAAIYWTRAVQYFGGKHVMHDQNLQLLWPLLDITTTLDPQLIPAYHSGATFLSDAPPRGAGQPDLAVKLLERGIQANPDNWRLYQDLGNVYYFDKKDYAKAAEAFATGSNYPGAYIWMKTMAAKIAAEGESLETSYFLWKQVYDTAKEPQTKENAEIHLMLIKAQMDCQQIDKLVDEYEKQNGKRATAISDLLQAGLLKGLPQDPAGYPYILGADGEAELNPRSTLAEKKAVYMKMP